MYDAILSSYFPEATVQMDFQCNITLVFKNVMNGLRSHLPKGMFDKQAQSFPGITLASVFCFDENAHVIVFIATLMDIHFPDKDSIFFATDIRIEPLRLTSDKILIPIKPLAFRKVNAARVLMITVEIQIIALAI